MSWDGNAAFLSWGECVPDGMRMAPARIGAVLLVIAHLKAA